MLKTKCYKQASDGDGLKISVMRFTPKTFQYDVLMLDLSPPSRLLMDYRLGKMKWDDYEREFSRILDRNVYLEELMNLASTQDVTIYCVEKYPKKCHRRLIAEEVKRRRPDIDVVIE